MIRYLAALSLVTSAPAIPQTVEQDPIPRVICPTSNGYSAGTAFRIGPSLLLSVAHVTSAGECKIDGQRIKVIYSRSDFSIIEDRRAGKFLRVDCRGYFKGHKYLAIGHARALEKLTFVELVGTGEKVGDLSLLAGVFTVQPGQSGGPIIDEETGMVVGTVNTAEWSSGISGSIALKDTAICGEH